MEFGKVPTPQLAQVDFTLPADSALTQQTLNAAKPKQHLKVHVGCASWAQKVWKGNLYPPKTKDADFLTEYAKQFNMIELNTTHYRMYDAATITKWKEKAAVNPDFKFCPKFNQLISHVKRLKGADEITTAFYEAMLAFEDKLGPMFLQLNENFAPKSFPELKAYLQSLPRDVQVCVELRHKDWFAQHTYRNEAFGLMHSLGMGAVITDTAGRRDVIHMEVPAPYLFIRFVGNALHPTDYVRIDHWVQRIKSWHEQGLQNLYFGMHQSDELASPVLCQYLIDQLNNSLNLNIAAPRLLSQNTLF